MVEGMDYRLTLDTLDTLLPVARKGKGASISTSEAIVSKIVSSVNSIQNRQVVKHYC